MGHFSLIFNNFTPKSACGVWSNLDFIGIFITFQLTPEPSGHRRIGRFVHQKDGRDLDPFNGRGRVPKDVGWDAWQMGVQQQFGVSAIQDLGISRKSRTRGFHMTKDVDGTDLGPKVTNPSGAFIKNMSIDHPKNAVTGRLLPMSVPLAVH
jgi:hypothetical protein